MVNHYCNDDLLEQIRANVVRLSINGGLERPESQQQLLEWSRLLDIDEYNQP